METYSLKWFAGIIAGFITTILNIDRDGDDKVETNEIIAAVNDIVKEAFDDLPEGLSLKNAIADTRVPERKAAAINEFIVKFDLTNDEAERLVELSFEMLIVGLSIQKKAAA